MTAATMSIQDAAVAFRDRFTLSARDDGSHYWTWKASDTLDDDTIRSMVFKAHEDGSTFGMMPDDYRYEYIVDALDNLAESGDDDDRQREWVDGAVDIYNADRVKWLASHLGRAGYVDDAISEYGWDEGGGIYQALGVGQYMERCEVLDLVRAWLTEWAETQNADA